MTQSDQSSTPDENKLPEAAVQVQELIEKTKFQLLTEPAMALDIALENCKVAAEINTPDLIALSLLMLGLVYTAIDDPASARASFEHAEKHYTVIQPARAADVLMEFARNCSIAGDYDTALEYLDRAMDYCHRYGLRAKEADCLNRSGIVHAQHQNYDLAFKCFHTAIVIADEENKPIARANAWINLGNLYRLLGEFSKALGYSSKALALSTSIDMPKLIMLCLNNIGIIYTELGEHSDALEYFLRCEMYLNNEMPDNDKNYSNTISNIGNLYEKLGNFEKALEYHERALNNRRKIGDRQGEASSLHNLGVMYVAMGEYETGLEYATQSLAIREILDDPLDLALSLNCTGNALDYLGRFDEAISHHLRSIALADKAGDRINKAYYLLGLGSAYLHKGTCDQAMECLRKALALAEDIGARPIVSEIFHEMANTYRALGDLQSALEYFERYHQTEKDTYKVINSQKMRNLQILHEVEQTRKETEIYRLKNVELASAFNELEETNRQLQAVNTEKNELMNIVAHDLKNPLSSIMMLADILRNDNTLTPEEVMDFSDNILTSSERMFNLITNLLDVNAIENRLDDLIVFPFDVVPIVQYTARQFQSRAAKKDIILHEIYEQPSIHVVAEEDSMLQILDNLVSNAIKFSPTGKNIWLAVRYSIDPSAPEAQMVRIEVRDEGPGLSEDDKSKLFQKFTPLSAQPTAGEHSTGLGLSIVKRLIESMKGKVWCESEAGSGATFIIELPPPAPDTPEA